MNKEPFFSVVIPTYNSEKTIIRTLLSVKKQIFKNFEVIIVDDGSQDNTVFLINKFIKKNYLDIKIYQQRNSKGPAAPRNIGIKKSKSNRICFLDSDDYWFSNKLIDAYYFLKDNNENDVLTSNEIMIHQNKKKKLFYGPVSKNFYLNLLIKGNKLSTSSTIVKKSFLIDNNILFNENKNFSSVEDYDLWLQIARKSGKFKFLNKFHGLYILNQNSISKNRILHFQNSMNVINYHLSKINYRNKIFFLFLKVKTRIRVIISFFLISIKEKNYKLLLNVINQIFISKL